MEDFTRISTPSSAASLFFAALPADTREERVFVLPLDGNGKVLAEPILVSVGHEDGTAQIDAGTIFREALKAGAEEIIVAHNHPSGDLMPNNADIAAREGVSPPFAAGRRLALDFLVDDRDSIEIPRKAAMAIHGHVGDNNDIPAWGRYRLKR